jgi:hypothetical protein
MADQAQRMAAVSEQVRRSAPLPDGVEGAAFRCQEQLREHLEFAARTRQAWQAAQAGTGPRPFVSRGGVAVRSEQVTSEACLAVGATPEEAFMIHHTDADGNPLSVSPDVPVPVPDDAADRSAAGYRREISR